MPGERPQWCKDCQCPNYPGGGNCRLERWMKDGWPGMRNRTKRNKFRTEWNEMAKSGEGKAQLVQLCVSK